MGILDDPTLDPEEIVNLPYHCAALIDWKILEKFRQKKTIARIAILQALALADQRDGKHCQPVFFTDLQTGFRCYIIINRRVHTFHPPTSELSLESGIALMRYFIKNRGSLAPADREHLAGIPAGVASVEDDEEDDDADDDDGDGSSDRDAASDAVDDVADAGLPRSGAAAGSRAAGNSSAAATGNAATRTARKKPHRSQSSSPEDPSLDEQARLNLEDQRMFYTATARAIAAEFSAAGGFEWADVLD